MVKNYTWIKRCLIVMLIGLVHWSFAQQVSVSGKVTSVDDGLGLPGVNVVEKGTTNGSVTDADGVYKISVGANAVLVFSSIGFETQEITVGGRAVIDIAMNVDTKTLDEVVVIGYGVANKRDLTGSIVKLDGSVVADKPNTDPVASLQGKVAGLSVVNNGTPGKTADIRIRGTGSIGNIHPLYVVNGILNDNIDFLNPNDIESIEVLKDASSLAIFGNRGANGVILITTKKAKEGKTVINFNSTASFKQLVNPIKMANAADFKTLYAEENQNNGTTPYDLSTLTSDTDWIKAVTQVGARQTYNINVSTSTAKNNFSIGVGYINDDGIILHENLKKLTISMSDEAKLTNNIKVGFTFNTARQDNPYTFNDPNQNRLDDARKVIPLISADSKPFTVQDPYSTNILNQNIYSGLDVALQNAGVINPVLEIENTYNKVINVNYRNVGSLYADINFLKDFNFRATWYGDISNQNTRQYNPLYYAYDPLNNTPYLYNNRTSVYYNNHNITKWQQDYLLNYKKNIGDHSIAATAGFTTYYVGDFESTINTKQGSTSSDAPIPNNQRFWYPSSQFGKIDANTTGSVQSESTIVSVLGRVMYNYKGKYYLNGSYRDDGSSRLPAKNRWQGFWSVGAAWDISDEGFIQNIEQINFLKIKGSYGVLGNQTASYADGTPIPYPAYPKLNTGTKVPFGSNLQNANNPAWLENPNLKWESIQATEVGLEADAFNNRLHLEAAYFNRKTVNLMTYVSRASLGLLDELINFGSLRNWGEEISAIWRQGITSDLRAEIGGNITFLNNKVLNLSPDFPNGFLSVYSYNNGSAESRTQVGHPIGSFYGYEVAGIFQSYADILSSPIQSSIGAYRPGDFKFKALSPEDQAEGVVTQKSRTFIGNPTPKFTYGAFVNLYYKQFNLSVDMQGVYGNTIFRAWASLESPFQRVNYAQLQTDRWHGPGTSNWVPLISQGDRINFNGSTYNLEDGSYFRFRNIQLGYNLPPSILSKLKLTAFRLYINSQNLVTIKHNNGYSPEYGGTATRFGYDDGGNAIPRVNSIGLNVTF